MLKKKKNKKKKFKMKKYKTCIRDKLADDTYVDIINHQIEGYG